MDSTRQNKISRLIQKEVADIFLKDAKNLGRGTLVTVTVVRISPDLSIARIFLSIFPSTGSKELIENINNKKKQIRYELAKRTKSQLRSVPELNFYIDDSLDYAEKIDKLLKK